MPGTRCEKALCHPRLDLKCHYENVYITRLTHSLRLISPTLHSNTSNTHSSIILYYYTRIYDTQYNINNNNNNNRHRFRYIYIEWQRKKARGKLQRDNEKKIVSVSFGRLRYEPLWYIYTYMYERFMVCGRSSFPLRSIVMCFIVFVFMFNNLFPITIYYRLLRD